MYKAKSKSCNELIQEIREKKDWINIEMKTKQSKGRQDFKGKIQNRDEANTGIEREREGKNGKRGDYRAMKCHCAEKR